MKTRRFFFFHRAVVAPTGAELYQLGIESDFPVISRIHLRDPGGVLERTETSQETRANVDSFKENPIAFLVSLQAASQLERRSRSLARSSHGAARVRSAHKRCTHHIARRSAA